MGGNSVIGQQTFRVQLLLEAPAHSLAPGSGAAQPTTSTILPDAKEAAVHPIVAPHDTVSISDILRWSDVSAISRSVDDGMLHGL